MLAAVMAVMLAAGDAASRIVVTGSASVTTAADLATIDYRIAGEGATSDAAVAAMVATRGRIAAQTGVLDARTGTVSVTTVRGPECRGDDDDRGPRLSNGKCAVAGYVAAMT